MLEAAANTEAKDKKGNIALHLAIKGAGSKECFSLLLPERTEIDDELLCSILCANKVDIVQELYRHDEDFVESYLCTDKNFSALRRKYEIVKLVENKYRKVLDLFQGVQINADFMKFIKSNEVIISRYLSCDSKEGIFEHEEKSLEKSILKKYIECVGELDFAHVKNGLILESFLSIGDEVSWQYVVDSLECFDKESDYEEVLKVFKRMFIAHYHKMSDSFKK